MANSVTNLTALNSTTNATSYDTASISPTAGSVLFATVWNQDGDTTDQPTPTVSGLSLTWTQEATVQNQYDRETLFWAPSGGTPGSGAVTADFGAATQHNCTIIIDQVTGCDTTDPIVQSVVGEDPTPGVGGTTLSITLAAFGSANNSTYGAFGGSNDTGTSAAGSGFTELSDVTHEDSGFGIRTTEWKVANDTGVDITFSTTVFREGIAAEIRAATSGIGSGILNGPKLTKMRLVSGR